MAKMSLAGFKDPVRRPRYIMWTFAIVFGLAAFVVIMLGATSTKFFCAQICHKVQDDTIAAYEKSVHNHVSCMACHEPVNADPVTFLIAKVKSGLEVIPTVGNTFELPLNAGSALALKGGKEMGSQQCTQCHSPNREATPSEGMIINHQVHADAGIWCTVCHNRVAHNDAAAPPKLIGPDGHPNVLHPDFMKMKYCFRCHDLEGKVKMTGPTAKAAPGTCSTCHTPTFNLVPASHNVADWSVKAHGEAAKAIIEELGAAKTEAATLKTEIPAANAYLADPVNECDTCHIESKFCQPCHDRLKVVTPAP
jgi:nitrate/TMAO reductase-like tetraheme cytochrome c subunit